MTSNGHNTHLRASLLMLCAFIALCAACRAEVARSPLIDSQSSLESFSVADMAPLRSLTQLKMANAEESIEPLQPAALAGFGGIYRRFTLPSYDELGGSYYYFLPYTSVDLPPRIKLLLFQGINSNGGVENFALFSVDLIAVTADVTVSLVKELQKDFPNLGFSQGNVVVVATHTHAAHGGLSRHPLWSAVASERYSPHLHEEFLTHASNVVHKASTKLDTVDDIVQSRTELQDFNISRLDFMAVDKNYLRLDFYAADKRRLGCMQSYAVHPTHFGLRQRVLSSDIPGHIEKAFVQQVKDECFFINGAVGNADSSKITSLDSYSNEFTKAAIENVSKKVLAKTIRFGSTAFALPQPTINHEACGSELLSPFVSAPILDSLPSSTKVSYLSIGDTVLVFTPGEPVYTTATNIKSAARQANSRFNFAHVVSTTDDYIGYMIDDSNYSTSNLEACSTLYGESTESTVVNAVSELLHRAFD